MHNDTHSFIVRIWYEVLDREGPIEAWRGSIEHVGHGGRLHFQDLEQVVDFIQEQARLERGMVAPGSVRAEPGSNKQGDPPD